MGNEGRELLKQVLRRLEEDDELEGYEARTDALMLVLGLLTGELR